MGAPLRVQCGGEWVEPGLKEEAEEILTRLGLTPTAAITMLYKQIVMQRSLPFEVAQPNATTLQAMQDAEEGRDLIRAEDLNTLLAAASAAALHTPD